MTPPAGRVVVVGAGISGLVAARELGRAGHAVTVVDKGRGVGGRANTRRIGDARLDHGAQFFTVRTERFQGLVDELTGAGIADVWTRGWSGDGDGHPRYRCPAGMSSLAKHLVATMPETVEVRTATRVAAVGADATVTLDGGESLGADRVLVTSPVPQTIELLAAGGAEVPEALRAVRYLPTFALLVVVDRPSPHVPDSGAVYRAGPFGFIADNQRKGVSSQPAMTFHLDEERSAERVDDDLDAVHADLLDLAAPWLDGTEVVESQVMRWRYATPVELHDEPCLVAGRLVFAGDAFGTAKIEGAATSGWAAVDELP